MNSMFHRTVVTLWMDQCGISKQFEGKKKCQIRVNSMKSKRYVTSGLKLRNNYYSSLFKSKCRIIIMTRMCDISEYIIHLERIDQINLFIQWTTDDKSPNIYRIALHTRTRFDEYILSPSDGFASVIGQFDRLFGSIKSN